MHNYSAFGGLASNSHQKLFHYTAGRRWGLHLQIPNRYHQSLDPPLMMHNFYNAVVRSISNWFELFCV